MSSGPIELFKNGVQVFDGEASPAPGGGSIPVQAIYSGDNVNIGTGTNEPLTFDTLVSGTELLDRTDPTQPLFLALGLYAITCYLATPNEALTAGGWMIAQAQVDGGISASDSSVRPEGGVTLNTLQKITDLSQPLAVNVVNLDGVAAHNFFLSSVIIVKLS